jgi:hypothetical protein
VPTVVLEESAAELPASETPNSRNLALAEQAIGRIPKGARPRAEIQILEQRKTLDFEWYAAPPTPQATFVRRAHEFSWVLAA